MLRALAVPALLLLIQTTALADGTALFRNAAVVSARTPHGQLAVTVLPVLPGRGATVLVLTDTLRPEDLPRIQHSLLAALTPAFLKAHTLSVMGSSIATAGQLPALVNGMIAQAGSLNAFSSLAALTPELPSNWGRVVIIGRLPAAESDTNYLSAALADLYTRHRASVSFWSLDGSVPDWAQNVCAASAGLVATSDFAALVPWLDDMAPVFTEVSWKAQIDAGGWPLRIDFLSAANERVSSLVTLVSARLCAAHH